MYAENAFLVALATYLVLVMQLSQHFIFSTEGMMCSCFEVLAWCPNVIEYVRFLACSFSCGGIIKKKCCGLPED